MTNDIDQSGPIAPVYRYYVEDLISGNKLAELDFRGVSYKLALNAAGEFTGSLVVRESNAVDLYKATLPGLTALYILRNNECVWGGIIWEREYNPDDKRLSVSASEFTSYLHHRKIWKTWNHEYGCTVNYQTHENKQWTLDAVNWLNRPHTGIGGLWTNGSTTQFTTAFDSTVSRRGSMGSMRFTRNAASLTSTVADVDDVGAISNAVADRPRISGPGPYIFSIWVRASYANWRHAIVINWYDDSGSTSFGASTNGIESGTHSANTWERIYLPVNAPSGATRADISVTLYTPSGNAVGGEQVWFTDAMLQQGIIYGEYFDGGFTDDNTNNYSWEGTTNASPSIKETSPESSWEVVLDYGSNVEIRPGSTVKLEFYEVENFRYNGYYRVALDPAPTKNRFYIHGGSAVADISKITYTGTEAQVYTKENHGYNTGDVISITYNMIGDTEVPQTVAEVKIDAPGGSNSNYFAFPSVEPPGEVLVEGTTMRPLPQGTYNKVTVGVRQDTYDYVRSLVQGTFNDFVGTDFPNVYITPGISNGLDIISRKTFGGYSVLKTAGKHGIAVGQAVQIQDVGPGYDGEFEVVGIEDGDSIVYVNGGDEDETPVSVTTRVISNIRQANGIATFTVNAGHGMSAGQNVVIDAGPNFPDLNGTFKVHDVPSIISFRVVTGSTRNYASTTLTNSTATVSGNTKIITSTKIKNNVATLQTSEPHGFSVGNTVTVSGAGRTFGVVEKSLDGPNGIAYVQTDGPHGLQVGSTVNLSGLTDVSDIVEVSSTTTSSRFTTSTSHNLKVGNSVTISGQDVLNITAKKISGNIATLTTSVPHNIVTGSTVTVTGLYDTYKISKHGLSEGVATYTLNTAHNIVANSEITVGGLSDTYTVITKAVRDGVVTLTTSRAHNLYEGQKIRVSGLGLPYDGEVTVTGFTDQRITYKVDSKYIDDKVAEAAKNGQKLNVPMTVAEQKTSGTITAPESYLNGNWIVSEVVGSTVKVVRGGNNYPTVTSNTGVMSALSILNGTYTTSGSSSTTFSYPKTANNEPLTQVPQAVKDDDVQAQVSRLSVYSGTHTITATTPTSFTIGLSLTSSVTRAAALRVEKQSIFNGNRTVTTVPAKDRFTFSLTGYPYSMVEVDQGEGSYGTATAIFAGSYTITAVDTVNNTFSYNKTYQDLDERQVQNTGTMSVHPLAIVSTFGPFPGNADIQFVFPDNEYSGVNIEPALYRGFELKSVGEALDEYASNINGFEYRIDCEYIAEEDRFIKKFILLPIDFPNPPAEGEVSPLSRFGADKLVFEYPAGSVATFSMRESAEEAATRFFALGESTLGPDVGPYIGVASAEDLLRGDRDGRRWPLLDASDTVDGVDDKTVLHAYAKRFLSELQPPFASFQISVNGSRPPYVGTYKPGDWCSIVVNDPWMQMRLASDLEPRNDVIVRKIDSISVSVPDGVTYPETVTVNLVAEWEVDKRG